MAGKSSKSLVIVESPAKAKTIGKFLGKGYKIKASMGHVRDLVSKGRGKARFGIDLENNYAPNYEPIKTREKTLNELKKAAQESSDVYLAPDPDREGEAIAWHLAEALHLPAKKTHRITFNAITKNEVNKAIENSRDIDMDLVNAQQARRILDRVVGFSLSPLLWKKVSKGLSAGRVQSVAVRLVVEREKSILAFNPEEYWKVTALLSEKGKKTAKSKFEAKLAEWDGKRVWGGEKKKPKDCLIIDKEELAAEILKELEEKEYKVIELKERKVTNTPDPSYITSTLQQGASTNLSFGTSKTMRIAQQLYEGVEIDGTPVGLITYMRTDSFRIAPEAIAEARSHIESNYSKEYLPEKPNFYKSKGKAQDAHEAIRPTNVSYTPESIKKFLSNDQYKLYDLIWRKFIASQMTPAKYLSTTASIEAGRGIFEAKGRKVLFDGHTVLGNLAKKKSRKKKDDEVNDDDKENNDQELPLIEKDDNLDCHEISPLQKFTNPPSRYSEASLVRALEKEGIGRPSTYAPIIKTIQDRGYVRLEKRRFFATELGIGVTELLLKGFPDILDYKFTAGMEDDLDRIADGDVDWVKMLDDFYKPFEAKLGTVTKELEPLKGKPAPNGEKCPLCESDMQIRYSKSGAFLSCSTYPECKGTQSLEGEAENAEDEDGNAILCPKCQLPMLKKRSRYGDFLACSNYPQCKQILPLDRNGKVVELPEIKMDCEKCGKPLTSKMGRRGPFVACTGYPECKNALPLDKEGNVVILPKITGTCEKCEGEMVVKSSRRGPFLACTAFPKCRNAKPIPKDAKEGDHIDFSKMPVEEEKEEKSE
ncbi:MAG: type I DNA topoisomerase [Planctomycetota bacterium]|jgi:DNA topoisomerase-1